uniref:Uncharacterized protein n=2 Tax=Palpitomonas bilix TaxID=652834 RepID=A0A7S3G742_9EUKA|mmetsp:Transcript_31307/g.82079  ORF Transcript_31307/g.82079 Transcript_31307/m.82079 type:complete len:687 (+) Transcript_31307:180-2240(+)
MSNRQVHAHNQSMESHQSKTEDSKRKKSKTKDYKRIKQLKTWLGAIGIGMVTFLVSCILFIAIFVGTYRWLYLLLGIGKTECVVLVREPLQCNATLFNETIMGGIVDDAVVLPTAENSLRDAVNFISVGLAAVAIIGAAIKYIDTRNMEAIQHNKKMKMEKLLNELASGFKPTTFILKLMNLRMTASSIKRHFELHKIGDGSRTAFGAVTFDAGELYISNERSEHIYKDSGAKSLLTVNPFILFVALQQNLLSYGNDDMRDMANNNQNKFSIIFGQEPGGRDKKFKMESWSSNQFMLFREVLDRYLSVFLSGLENVFVGIQKDELDETETLSYLRMLYRPFIARFHNSFLDLYCNWPAKGERNCDSVLNHLLFECHLAGRDARSDRKEMWKEFMRKLLNGKEEWEHSHCGQHCRHPEDHANDTICVFDRNCSCHPNQSKYTHFSVDRFKHLMSFGVTLCYLNPREHEHLVLDSESPKLTDNEGEKTCDMKGYQYLQLIVRLSKEPRDATKKEEIKEQEITKNDIKRVWGGNWYNWDHVKVTDYLEILKNAAGVDIKKDLDKVIGAKKWEQSEYLRNFRGFDKLKGWGGTEKATRGGVMWRLFDLVTDRQFKSMFREEAHEITIRDVNNALKKFRDVAASRDDSKCCLLNADDGGRGEGRQFCKKCVDLASHFAHFTFVEYTTMFRA